ncbi:berberine-like enzyme [Kordia periserrulae]|uniref:Berberine-like enzyme n=1 Tax=Kordia periserrulae TaxID=701523 RepID=A0A2T6C033_9FLAO|nr:FAD-binding protein [Kordia periserrulae]PTX61681.1 berberine-like enzyme [Kordia periserrulae]
MNYTATFSGKNNLKHKELTENNFQESDFTIQCWLQTAAAGELVSKHTDETSFALQINNQGNITFSVTENNESRSITATNISVLDEHWYHITAVKTENFLRLHINDFSLTLENHTETVAKHTTSNFTVGGHENNFFNGKLGQIAIWSKALFPYEVSKITMEEVSNTNNYLITIIKFIKEEIDHIFPESLKFEVQLKIRNTSFETLKLKSRTSYIDYVPEEIQVHEEVCISFLSSSITSVINQELCYENSSGSTTINILKNINRFDTVISAVSEKDLVDDVSITKNETFISEASINIGENMVVVNARNVYNFLNGLQGYLKSDQIQTPGGNLYNEIEFNKASQVFNRRFQLKPFVIIYCECTKDVERVYKDAIANNLPIRVRSGGHDHEAECTGTDVILLDMTRINHVDVSHDKEYARIGPGIRFRDLTPQLAEEGVMIPHGTCATVGVAGFTFGGGWGPWTRKHGMNCEGLIGATIVLGNGDVVQLKSDGSNKKDLLWALKGGGGMSYGIVTELQLKVFPLPKKLIKYELEWNPYDKTNPSKITINSENKLTKNIIGAWQDVIINKNNEYSGSDFKNDQLIGTNLKVSGKHLEDEVTFNSEEAIHNCIMYGYWQGTEESLLAFVNDCFTGDSQPYELRLIGKGGQRLNYADDGLMSAWDRESFSAIKRTIRLANTDTTTLKTAENTANRGEATYDKIYRIGGNLAKNSSLDAVKEVFEQIFTKKPLPPDLDAPAPHKITSRLAHKKGLCEKGISQLISSLTSELILPNNRSYGLFNYITLGAIVGEFYDNMSEEDKKQSAFPYKDCAYTIQYQTWWNTELIQKEEAQNNPVYDATNRALDWMQKCRDYEIENTSGAFISFKDASIPTKTYFGDSYKDLINIKEKYSKDPLNHFRTRKTII